MTKVYPLKLDDPLWAQIQKAADNLKESEAVAMRIALRAGLRAMEREHYRLTSVTAEDFEAAGEPTDAPVGGPSIPSRARYSVGEEKLFALNEDPPSAAPLPSSSKPGKGAAKSPRSSS